MKKKFIIRETTVSNRPPMTGLYFAGFMTGGRGATLVFGKDSAQQYDTREAVTKVLVSVKEISGRNTWRWEVFKSDHAFEPNIVEAGIGQICRACGIHALNHGDEPDVR